jgi:hypothetical protein
MKGSPMTNYEIRTYDTDLRICVFCYTTTFAYICPDCHDYKGLMAIGEAEHYLDEDLTDYLPLKNV